MPLRVETPWERNNDKHVATCKSKQSVMYSGVVCCWETKLEVSLRHKSSFHFSANGDAPTGVHMRIPLFRITVREHMNTVNAECYKTADATHRDTTQGTVVAEKCDHVSQRYRIDYSDKGPCDLELAHLQSQFLIQLPGHVATN